MPLRHAVAGEIAAVLRRHQAREDMRAAVADDEIVEAAAEALARDT